jgi:hypothetical protein
MIQIIAIALLVGLALGGFGGWSLANDHYQAKQARAIQDALIQQKKDINQAHEIESKALKDAHDLELKNNVIVQEIPKYITKIQRIKSECSYSRGVVRLLRQSAGEDVHKPAPVSDAEDSTASHITESDGIIYTNRVLSEYNKFRNQCNALIDYVQANKNSCLNR